MYKHRENDTIFIGPVWDFDIAFENDQRTCPINDKKDFVYRSGGSAIGNMKAFVDNIVIRNAAAKKKMLEIWGRARESSLTEQHLLDFIDKTEEYLQESQKLNFIRWPMMNELVHENAVVWGSYAAEVQNVRRFMSERLLWMDNRLGYTYNQDGIADVSIDFSLPYYIYNLSGQLYTGHKEQLPQGVYIVRQGTKAKKLQVR
jgi:hypothetical protein